MKTQIDIYTGFLSSGKTSLIKQVLESSLYSRERIVVILCEAGEEEIDEDNLRSRSIFIKRLAKDEPFEAGVIKEVYQKYRPHRIIIEQNGMSSLEALLAVLDEHSICKSCVVNRIVNVIDTRTIDMLMNIVGPNLIEQISNSDLVVLNYVNKPQQELDKLKMTIKTINKSTKIISIGLPEDYNKYLEYSSIAGEYEKKCFRNRTEKLFALFILLSAVYFLQSIFMTMDFNLSSMDFSVIQVMNTIFISILMQAFPFLLLGVFVSSVIQVFVTRDMISNYFPQNKVTSLLVAVLGGIIFPVCDCAIVPVAAQLVKKGVPLYAAVTFMLAAPVVNPIVIVSTLYAFPGEPSVTFYRVFLGITIAVASGLTFLLFPEDEKKLLIGSDSLLCNCYYCNSFGQNDGVKNKIAAIFKHAGEEFFDVGRFLVIGAFLTSVFQVTVSKDLLEQLGNSGVASLIIMMAAAFMLSVCSSSDAFIARSFTNQFSMGSVMGFLVLGPMIDIKNVLMLLGCFKKRFVVKFLFIVCAMSFALLYFFTRILF